MSSYNDKSENTFESLTNIGTINSDTSGSHQNRSGIMDNSPAKSDELFEEQNVPIEGEVGNTEKNPNTKGDETGIDMSEDEVPANNGDDDEEEMDIDEDVTADDEDSVDMDMDEADLDDLDLADLEEDEDLDDDEEDPFL